MPIADASRPAVSPLAAWYGLAVLTIVTLFAVVDRQVLVLLAEPIRIHFGLTDLQLGLLQGTGVAIFAALATYPIAWLADRFDRRVVLACCVAIWSLAVVACGLAQGYWPLLFAGAMVGAGEAGLGPITFSLVPDLFSERRRQVANSVFGLAAGAGGSLALILCGQLIAAVEATRTGLPSPFATLDSWRLSFFAAAAPAPLMILLILSVAAASRTGTNRTALANQSVPHHRRPILPFLRRHPATFIGFYLGNGLSTLGFSAVTSWIVVIGMRQFGQTPAQVGAAFGVASLIALPLGFVLSIFIMRTFLERVGPSLPIRAVRVSFAVSAGLTALMLATTSAIHLYVIVFFISLALISAGMLYPTAAQNMAPRPLRARVLALQGIVSASFAAAAPPMVGLLSDQFKSRPNGLLLAAVIISVPCLVVSIYALGWCERSYKATAEDAKLYNPDGDAAVGSTTWVNA